MKVLLYDVRWCEDLHSIKFQASAGERYGEKIIRIGDNLSIDIQSQTMCAGSKRDDTWAPCPDQSQGKRKCESCRNREGNFIFTSFDGFNTDNLREGDLEKIAGEHLVYLALFQKDAIKVGVCKKERKILRQLEQGSHATLFIAETQSGTQARQIETLIRNAGLKDKINPSQKKEFILPHLSDEDCQVLLNQTFEQFCSAVEAFPSLKTHLLQTPAFYTWEDYYQLQNLSSDEKPYHYVKLETQEIASGKVIALKGPFILIDTSEEVVCIGAKDLIGKMIEFEPKPPQLDIKGAFQSALF